MYQAVYRPMQGAARALSGGFTSVLGSTEDSHGQTEANVRGALDTGNLVEGYES